MFPGAIVELEEDLLRWVAQGQCIDHDGLGRGIDDHVTGRLVEVILLQTRAAGKIPEQRGSGLGPCSTYDPHRGPTATQRHRGGEVDEELGLVERVRDRNA